MADPQRLDLSRVSPRAEKAFWSKVDMPHPEACWRWKPGARGGSEYGRFKWNRKEYMAHRFSYALSIGPLEDGMCACHRCDNPICVNPFHLFADTAQGNVADKVAKGRQARGENCGKSKLSNADIQEVFALYNTGQWKQGDLAKRFSVGQFAISSALRGFTWGHLGLERTHDPDVVGQPAINAAKTHCAKGHPLSGDNLYEYGGKRSCKTCRRGWCADYRLRRRGRVD